MFQIVTLNHLINRKSNMTEDIFLPSQNICKIVKISWSHSKICSVCPYCPLQVLAIFSSFSGSALVLIVGWISLHISNASILFAHLWAFFGSLKNISRYLFIKGNSLHKTYLFKDIFSFFSGRKKRKGALSTNIVLLFTAV